MTIETTDHRTIWFIIVSTSFTCAILCYMSVKNAFKVTGMLDKKEKKHDRYVAYRTAFFSGLLYSMLISTVVVYAATLF